MTNPARELAFFLQEWRTVAKGTNFYVTRGLKENNADQWRVQIRCAQLLAEVDERLAAIEASGTDVDHYRLFFAEWARGLFAPDHSWNTNTSNNLAVISPHAIALLKAVGDLFDNSQLRVAVTETRQRTSLGALDEIIDDLADAPLSDQARRYVFELINSCRKVLQESGALDSVDLFARVHELVGFLTVLTNQMMDDPQAKPWAEKIRNAAARVAPWATATARFTGGALEATANVLQITD